MSIAILTFRAADLVVLAWLLGGTAIWAWCIQDCIRRETDATSKLAWLLAILIANLLGAALYFFARVRPRRSHAPIPS